MYSYMIIQMFIQPNTSHTFMPWSVADTSHFDDNTQRSNSVAEIWQLWTHAGLSAYFYDRLADVPAHELAVRYPWVITWNALRDTVMLGTDGHAIIASENPVPTSSTYSFH